MTALQASPQIVVSPEKPLKPRLRGVSHEIACYVSGLAGSYLVSQARGPGNSQSALIGATVYSLSLFFLFTASALYHRPTWSPTARARMRRVDHSAIYLLIAGTVTPIALLTLSGNAQTALLLTSWIGAAVGIAKSLLWIRAPKALSALVYVVIACSSIPFLPQIGTAIGPHAVALIIFGGLVYILGAVVYALRQPDPVPTVFGYHEIFHALVIVAGACHYWAILSILRRYS